MRYLALLGVVLTLSGCFGIPSREDIEKELTAKIEARIEQQMKTENADFVEYKESKKKLEKIEVVPQKGETKLDALVRERQETKAVIAKTKDEIAVKERLVEDGESKVKSLDAQIKQAEQDRLRFWANLVGGISAGLAIILGIAAFLTATYPILPRVLRYFALGFGALAALSFGFAAIVPYLTIIGICFGVIVLGAGIFFWFKDRKSLTQVVNTVENVKTQIPNYKDKFKQFIDPDVDRHVNAVRGGIKKKLEKLAKVVK